jgi:hypothetical protein
MESKIGENKLLETNWLFTLTASVYNLSQEASSRSAGKKFPAFYEPRTFISLSLAV